MTAIVYTGDTKLEWDKIEETLGKAKANGTCLTAAPADLLPLTILALRRGPLSVHSDMLMNSFFPLLSDEEVEQLLDEWLKSKDKPHMTYIPLGGAYVCGVIEERLVKYFTAQPQSPYLEPYYQFSKSRYLRSLVKVK